MFDLNGLTALVTGATGGLGGAMARALHQQGATVALSGTRREALEALAAELGARTHVLPCNLADKAEVEALVPAAEAAMVASTSGPPMAAPTPMSFCSGVWPKTTAVKVTALSGRAVPKAENDEVMVTTVLPVV